MRKSILVVTALLFLISGYSQKKPAYVLYTKKGKKVSYKKMIRVLKEKDVVMFGEFHNNPISHWLELEVTKDLHQHRSIVMGAEMFETDNQQQLDDYVAGKINAKQFDSLARLWKNFPTDYKPLADYAKENKLTFAASNVPRRYASLVAKRGFEGLDSLSAGEKAWIAPLPIAYDPALPGYKKMLAMMPGHGGENLPKAQALKDATMANSILKYFKPGSLFIHYNGSYHSENYEGINWYLLKANPSLKIGTITTVSQKDIHTLLSENKNKADYIICVDEDMTTTY